jgi:multiple sugar transport system ATP-binding protein
MSDLSLRQISKRFGRNTVIDDISLAIADRAFAVLLGPSGCGKSTLLRLVAGLEAPTEGDIFIGGECVTEHTPRERGIAMVFQSYALYPHMTVYDNIAFGLTQTAMPRPDIDRRVQRAAQRLQIEHLLTRKPKELSGGQRQRVAIGRAIVREPKVFLFDEPLSNLDASLRTQMRLEFMQLHRELGTTVVYVTHDQAEAMTLASDIVVLRNGHVEQTGSPLDIYGRPRNRFVASFVGSPSMNMIEGVLERADASGARVAVAGGTRITIPVDARRSAAGSPVTVGVRPEHIDGHANGADGRSGGPKGGNGAGGAGRDTAVLDATVVAVEHLGSDSLLHARLPDNAMVTQRTAGTSDARPGDPVRLAVDPTHGHLFDAEGNAFPAFA